MARTFNGSTYLGRYDTAITGPPLTVAGWFKGGHSLGGTVFSLADGTLGTARFLLTATPGFSVNALTQSSAASAEAITSGATATPDA